MIKILKRKKRQKLTRKKNRIEQATKQMNQTVEKDEEREIYNKYMYLNKKQVKVNEIRVWFGRIPIFNILT